MGVGEAEYVVLSVGQPSTGRSSGPDSVTPTFEVSGLRDINLVRDVIDEDETSRVVISSLPTLVLVTEGELDIDTGRSDPHTLAAGESVLVPGPFEVIASEDGTAFVAAVVSEEIEGDESGTAATPVSTGNPQPGATPVAVVDSDGDGLSDSDETGTFKHRPAGCRFRRRRAERR